MVLSPLLFLQYIDDLRSVVPETVKVALFADDVFLTSSHHNKLIAEKELQPVVTTIAPAWQHWAAPSRIEQLERCLNKALREGQLKSTSVEALLRKPASAASQLCLSARDLLHRFQPAIYQRPWLTGLLLTPFSPALGKIQET